MIYEKAYAKLNLSLDIIGRRRDGYHLLRTVMQTVSLQDTVKVEESDTLSVICEGLPAPDGEENTVYRAAKQFFTYLGRPDAGAKITVQKHIPLQAGLGGGSADAAAALRGLNRLYQAGLSAGELCVIGAKIGADVPFCVRGGTLLAEGIGEELHRLPPMPAGTILIVKPEVGIETALAYQKIDAHPEKIKAKTEKMLLALATGDLCAVGAALSNAFDCAISFPEKDRIKKKMLDGGALGASMTGSGSAIFGLFQRETAAAQCAKLFFSGDSVFLCEPVNMVF